MSVKFRNGSSINRHFNYDLSNVDKKHIKVGVIISQKMEYLKSCVKYGKHMYMFEGEITGLCYVECTKKLYAIGFYKNNWKKQIEVRCKILSNRKLNILEVK